MLPGQHEIQTIRTDAVPAYLSMINPRGRVRAGLVLVLAGLSKRPKESSGAAALSGLPELRTRTGPVTVTANSLSWKVLFTVS